MVAAGQGRVYSCAIEGVLAIVGGKWKLFILWLLQHETLRYAELRRRIDGVSERVLINQLRELEADGLVHREQYPEVPPRVEYSLTEKGRSLAPALAGLAAWGETHVMGAGSRSTTGAATPTSSHANGRSSASPATPAERETPARSRPTAL